MNRIEITGAKLLTPSKRDFSIQWECISSVYEGQLNCCACGCQGDYLYTKHCTDILNVGRTSAIMHPSDERIKHILDEMSRSPEVGFIQDSGGWILEVHTETKDNWEGDEMEIGYRVYFKNIPLEHTDK